MNGKKSKVEKRKQSKISEKGKNRKIEIIEKKK